MLAKTVGDTALIYNYDVNAVFLSGLFGRKGDNYWSLIYLYTSPSNRVIFRLLLTLASNTNIHKQDLGANKTTTSVCRNHGPDSTCRPRDGAAVELGN